MPNFLESTFYFHFVCVSVCLMRYKAMSKRTKSYEVDGKYYKFNEKMFNAQLTLYLKKNGYKKKKDFMEYFCGEMNIQPSTVRDWQRGDHAPSKKEVIKQIGEKLNISDWKLLLTEEDKKQNRLEIIVVTNVIGGVGKTCVAQAIATILGHKKGNTLFVDGDSLRWMSDLTSDEYINLEKEKISSSKYMDILTLPRNLYSMYSFEAPEKRNLKSYLEKLSVENGYKYAVVDVNPGE